jgi:hypothetical protein
MHRRISLVARLLVAGLIATGLAATTNAGMATAAPSGMSSPTMLLNADGRLEAFAFGPGGIYHNYQSGGGWSGWKSLGDPSGGVAVGPVVGRNPDGRLEVFVLTLFGDLYHAWQDSSYSSGWSGWALMHDFGIGSEGGLDTQNDASGALNVLVAGDGDLWQFRSGSDGWKETDLGKPNISQRAVRGGVIAGRNLDGRMEAFALVGIPQTATSSVYRKYQTSSGGWSGWVPFVSCNEPGMRQISAVNNQDGRLELFGSSPTTGEYKADLCHAWQDPNLTGGWSGFANLGDGTLDSTIPMASAINEDGRLEVFAIRNGGELLHMWQLTAGGAWSGFASLGTGFAGGISAATNLDGRLELLSFRGGKPYHAWQLSPGGGWSGWAALDAG